MELRHLRYAVAIADERHFTRAARRLGIGQPPLSQQIKLLEKEIGTQLFQRLTRGVALTPAGEAFMPHARSALAAATQAVDAARRAARGEVGTLAIGFTSSASFNPLVPGIISRFRELHPDLTIRLVEQTTAVLLAGLAADEVDVAFIRPASDETKELVATWLPDEALHVALPERHRLTAATRPLDLAELAGEPFILYPRGNGRSLHDGIIAACRNAGFSPNIVQEAPQLASSINLVAAGVGVALVPESMCRIRAPGVAFAPIGEPDLSAQLCVAHARHRMQAATIRNFVGCATSMLAEQGEHR